MGNDGGSFSHRTEMCKQKRKEEKKDMHLIAKSKARLCAITKEPLRKPIAVCRLGLMYNQLSLLEYLIGKKVPKAFRHLRTKADFTTASKINYEDGVIRCPISMREFNGFVPFLFLWKCGCFLSEEATKELKMKETCVNC